MYIIYRKENVVDVMHSAGLFNLRGADIKYNPVFFSYALVTMDDVR